MTSERRDVLHDRIHMLRYLFGNFHIRPIIARRFLINSHWDFSSTWYQVAFYLDALGRL